ncbi:MAG: DUF1080 domain-containing protein [Bacteroidia bacterium]|nr:DUF1080 domain-containing protein [Bacteroidia bacterium]
MRTLLSLALVFTLSCHQGGHQAGASVALVSEVHDSLPGFQRLFNGVNLDGWHIVWDDKGTDTSLFAVEEGMIHVYPSQEAGSTQSFGGIITNKSFSRYTLRFQYKWGENKFHPRDAFVRDAGLIFHQHGPQVIWPNGAECQIQEGDTGDLWLIGTQGSSTVSEVIRNYAPEGQLVTRGTRNNRFQRFHRAYCWEQPGWNHVRVEVDHDAARFFVNEHLVNEVTGLKQWSLETDSWVPLTEGYLLLQAEGAELYYRDIWIREF